MKKTGKVKIGFICLWVLALAGCDEYQTPTSHFGTGHYYCYYHDVRTHQAYEGIAREKKEAVSRARQLCLTQSQDADHRFCDYSDCLFK